MIVVGLYWHHEPHGWVRDLPVWRAPWQMNTHWYVKIPAWAETRTQPLPAVYIDVPYNTRDVENHVRK